MRDAILLLKAAEFLRDRRMKIIRRIFIGYLILFAGVNFLLISISTEQTDFSSIVINYFNMANFSTVFVITLGNIYRTDKAIAKYDFLQFVAFLPVSKRAVSHSKFITIWLAFIPSFLVLVYQNIICYIRGLNGFAGYAGLCTVLVCLQFMILSSICGFNPYLNPKGKMSLTFSLASISIIFLPAAGIFVSIGLKNNDILYGIFGESFTGIFYKLEALSGSTGGLLVLLCIILSYALCCIFPERIFARKGWSV